MFFLFKRKILNQACIKSPQILKLLFILYHQFVTQDLHKSIATWQKTAALDDESYNSRVFNLVTRN